MGHVRTQVGIVGAGPAGLLLGQLHHANGIDSVIVENCSRGYLTGSRAAMTSLAEQYVGLPPEVSFESAGLRG